MLRNASLLIFVLVIIIGVSADMETVREWTFRHEFTSANAYPWQNQLLQVELEDRFFYVHSIDPNATTPVNCTVPNKLEVMWPIYTIHYDMTILGSGKAVVRQKKFFDVLDLTTCDIEVEFELEDVEFDQICELIIPHDTTFDCFINTTQNLKSLTYVRFDQTGKTVENRTIGRVLDFVEDGWKPEVYQSEDSKRYYALENKAEHDEYDSINPWNPEAHTKIRILDEDYKLLSEQDIETRMYFASSFAHANITVCDQYFNYTALNDTPNQPDNLGHTECRLYDADLKLRTTVKWHLPPESAHEQLFLYTGYVKVHNLPGGGALVLFQVSSRQVFYQYIDAEGVLSGNKVFFEYPKPELYNLEEEFNFAKMYIVEGGGKEERVYCGAFGEWNKFLVKCAKF